MKRSVIGIIVIVLVALLVSSLFVVGCETPTAEETIKYGVHFMLTGPGAGWGVPCLWGHEAWAAEVNEEGGIEVGGQRYLVEIIPFDTQADPAIAIEGVKKLIFEDEVVAIFIGVPTVAAVLPLLTENKIIGFSWPIAVELSPEHPYFFNAHEGSPFSETARYIYVAEEYPELQTVGLINYDNADGLANIADAEAAQELLGFTTVETVLFAQGVMDFYPVVAPVLNANPDFIDLGQVYPEEASLIVKALREQGYDGLIIAAQIPSALIIDIVGEENCENVIFVDGSCEPTWEGASSGMLDRYNRYIDMFDDYDGAHLAIAFSINGDIIRQAIEKADSLDPDEIRDALETYEFETVFGDGKFYGEEYWGISHMFPTPVFLSRIEDGETVTFEEISMKSILEQ